MKFFKTLIATTLGTLLALFILILVVVITVISTGGEPEPYINDHSILKLQFSGSLPAHIIHNPFNKLLNASTGNGISLDELKENLTKAAAHDKIKGVLLEIDSMDEGWANLEEAHDMIEQFRDSTNKFVYATTSDEGFNEQGYYLATAADSIFSPPASFFEFDGFYDQVTFYDGLLKKAEVKPEITRHGKYKGAVEPYFRKDLSKENRYQLTQLIDQVSTTFVQAAAQKSGKSVSGINAMLNASPHLTAKFGYQQGFIDSLLYADQLDSLIKKRMGLKSDETFSTVNSSRYAKVSREAAGLKKVNADGKIAVIYASGEIAPGTSVPSVLADEGSINASTFRGPLQDIAEDDNIRALVIRVNSPGGSGSTSDVIWHMIRKTSQRIPVIVSMGPVAASGGYYISMAADSIVAEPNTITGSIGVFATKFDAKQLFNDKLGITFDGVKSHDHADWLSSSRAFTPSEAKAFQHNVDMFYDTFITKVAEQRGLTKQQVDAIGQGRVWTGTDAKQHHLVDVLGGLDRAMEIAAQKAGLTHYSTEVYPKPKDLYQLLWGAAGNKVQTFFEGSLLGITYAKDAAQQLSIFKKNDPLLLFPYKISIQ